MRRRLTANEAAEKLLVLIEAHSPLPLRVIRMRLEQRARELEQRELRLLTSAASRRQFIGHADNADLGAALGTGIATVGHQAKETGSAGGAAVADSGFEIAGKDAAGLGHDEHVGDHLQV